MGLGFAAKWCEEGESRGEIYGMEGNEGGEESVGVCFDLFFPLCPSGKKECFFLC